MTEMYISVDIEASGPIPSMHSMLSLGACVVGDITKTFYCEFQPISDAYVPEAIAVPIFSQEVMLDVSTHEPIMGRGKAILASLKLHGADPVVAMCQFEEWVARVAGGATPLFFGWNAPFDWSFVNDYFWRYLGRNVFGITAIDAGAYYIGMMGCSFLDMRVSPQFYPDTKRHTHHALDDAIAQAESFAKILAYNGKKEHLHD